MLENLRPYYEPASFDAGYSVKYRPGIGVVLPTGRTLVQTIFNIDPEKKITPTATRNTPIVTSEHFNSLSSYFSRFFQKLARNYLKMMITQPFDIARLLLQVGSFNVSGVKPTLKNIEEDFTAIGASYYFTSPEGEVSEPIKELAEAESKPVQKVEARLLPLGLSSVDVMSALMSKEGTTALWKATNLTYIYQALLKTIESFLTGFFSSFLEIPDPFYIDIAYLPDPFKLLVLVLSACVLTGLVLSPLDLVRTKLIVTAIPSSPEERRRNEGRNPSLKRSLRDNVRMLRFWHCPVLLLAPTVVHSLFKRFVGSAVPYVVVTRFLGLASYELLRFIGDFVDLFVKLPVETIYRRAQVAYLLNRKENELSEDSIGIEVSENDLVVEFVGYKGMAHSLVSGFYAVPGNDNSGWQSMFRGWRVGVVNIVGRWGFKMAGRGDYNLERF